MRVASDWIAFSLTGPDRKEFLHGLVTADIRNLGKERVPCCLLTPKGRMQALFSVRDAGDSIEILCPPECVQNLEAQLNKMIMLSDAKLERVATPAGLPGPDEAERIADAWPRWGVDVDGETIPLEAGLDAALSYTKGCYMGQETISRIHHMGHVNRKLVRLRFEGGAPAAPCEIGGGKLTSSAGELALAMVRAEHAAPGTRLEAAGKTGVVF